MSGQLSVGGRDYDLETDLGTVAKFVQLLSTMPIEVLEKIAPLMEAQIKLRYVQAQVYTMEAFKDDERMPEL